jgi:surface polysaccharide O-acyltransferase-like enzyme
MHDAVFTAFNNFVATLQHALSSSITGIFFVSAGLMAIAFILSFFIKEIPMRHHDGDEKATPAPSA